MTVNLTETGLNRIVNNFDLIYNKNRQAAITQEISEIISGASAL